MTLTGINALLAFAPAPPAGTAPNPTGQMLQMLGTLVFMVVIIYFAMIRPQQKKAKEHENLLKTLKPGDKVVTSGGIIGVVISVKERSLSIRSADTKLEVLKSAVSEITEKVPGSTDS
ncbi:MAG: preprotein translocase subunit YajC [Chloroflexi bacterium]|nr:preprotein translocase subunit YajC [Chloroflexota bacterium]